MTKERAKAEELIYKVMDALDKTGSMSRYYAEKFKPMDDKEFLKYIFDNKNVNSITLSVFDSNKVAKNLYEKQGFIIEKTIEKPKLKYIMRRFR